MRIIRNLSKLTKPSMNLKEFIRRQEVLKLYRDLFRTSRKVEDVNYRKDLQDWIRRDFRANQHLSEADSINIYITYGKKCLAELEVSLAMAK